MKGRAEDKIILTVDRTLMSDYHHNEFIGFGTCAPPNFIPDCLFKWLFFPPMKTNRGIPVAAPYGLRKIEAQLMKEGFDVLTVDPDHLGRYVSQAKVLGIHCMDPFGLGPASTTLASILRKEPFLARYFRTLLEKPEVRRAKRRDLKIIVGGPGAWQFQYREKFVAEHGVNCVVEGEAERVIGRIMQTAIDNEKLPKFYKVSVKETPDLHEIPEIMNPSINGLTEIGRGCCRGCEFCSVTLRPLRWYPYEKITKEIDTNQRAGYSQWSCLHAEDVMLYGSRSTMPNDRRLTRLHEIVLERCEGVSWSHCSLASVAAKPRLFSRISEMILSKQPWWGAEVGIETGSPRLAERIMPAKAHPFKAEKWPDVVRTGMGIMHDNNMFPACTLIVGSPEETEEDVIQTIELMEDLRHSRSLIVPLFFVPMGRLKNERWFEDTQMTELHKELLIKCLDHGFYWMDDLIDLSFAGNWYTLVLRAFYRIFTNIIRYKARSIEAA